MIDKEKWKKLIDDGGQHDCDCGERRAFVVGEPIPSVWLHMEFNFSDTMKYLGGVVVENEEEAKRLTEKYL